MPLGFFRPKTLEFDEACRRSFAAARIFSGHNGRKEIAPADLLRGLLHTKDPESVKFLRTMKFGYGDEVASLQKLGGVEQQAKVGKDVGVSSAVKKVLARANRKAADQKKEKVGFLDLLSGLIEERPDDVTNDLVQVGKNWEELERYVKQSSSQPH